MATSDSKTTMDPNLIYFPEKILFEILMRLPVKSLCRFKCVSKQCLAIISDSDFVDANFNYSSKSVSPKLLISVRGDDRHKICFFSVDYPEQGQSSLHATSHGSIDFEPAASISSSPSGLICFTCVNGIKIGNPFTGKFDLIPTHVSNIFLEKSIWGYDPIDKNHVILKLDKRRYAPHITGRCRVFSLVESKFHDASSHRWISAGESAVCINGIIYFTAWGRVKSGNLGPCLFAFDVRTEIFQMIHRPPESIYNSLVELVIEYKGHLALVCDRNRLDDNTTEDELWMWILEDSENLTWRFQSFVVPWRENLRRDGISMEGELFSQAAKLFGATPRSELVFATPLSRSGLLYLFLYEVAETNTLRRFKVDGFGGVLYGSVRLNFVRETLHSLNSLTQKERKQITALR